MFGAGTNNIPKYGYLRLPMRGNAFDIHFINVTESEVSAKSFYFDGKNVPQENLRNLIFVPNQRKNDIYGLPPDIRLRPLQRYEVDGKKGVIARKSIQGVVVYNNPLSYDEYIYNPKANFTTYSSFMWTNGTRTQADGINSYKNAMSEIDNFFYDVEIPIKGAGETLFFRLKMKAVSNLDIKLKEHAAAPGIVADFNNIAAILTIVGGILNIPSNPAAGIVGTLSGVAWTISGTLWMMNDDFNYTLISLYNKGLSWLSSPFDIIVYPEDYKVENSKGETIAIPEFDRERCSLTYFLGTHSNPQSVIVQMSGTEKGDLYVYIISKNLIKKSNIDNILDKNQNYLEKIVEDVIEQKRT